MRNNCTGLGPRYTRKPAVSGEKLKLVSVTVLVFVPAGIFARTENDNALSPPLPSVALTA